MATLRSDPILLPESLEYPSYPSPAVRKIRFAYITFSRYLAESRPERVICLLVGVWLFSGFDYALTLVACSNGLASELNPIGEWFLLRGPYALLAFKLGLVIVGSIGLVRYRHRLCAELASLLMFAVLFSVIWRWKMIMDMHEYAITSAPSGYYVCL